MKFVIQMMLIFMLVASALRAQDQLKFVNIPQGLSRISIAGSGFIGTDSSGNVGLIGKNGLWLSKRRFSQILGPVAGTYFAISKSGNSANQQSYSIRDAWMLSSFNEFSEPVFYDSAIWTRSRFSNAISEFRIPC